MDNLTNQEVEFVLQCVKINRLKLSPIPSNDIEKNLCRIVEGKLEKYLESKKQDNETNKVPSPTRGVTALEKIEFYDNLVANGLNTKQLYVVKERLRGISTYFDTEASMRKLELIECINQFIKERDNENT